VHLADSAKIKDDSN